MTRILAIFFTGIIFFACKAFNSCVNKQEGDQVWGIHVLYTLPLSNWTDDFEDVTNSYEVIYYNDIIMYKPIYKFDSAVDGKLVHSEMRHDFFLFHKDSLFGYAYYPYSSPVLPRGRSAVDSIHKRISLESTSFDTLVNFKPDSSYFDADGNLVNVYKPPVRQGAYTDYTLYFYYTKNLKNVKETFSWKMDSIKNMKLFRVRVVPDKALRPGFPKKEIIHEMKEIPLENTEEILSYFKRYEEEHLKK